MFSCPPAHKRLRTAQYKDRGQKRKAALVWDPRPLEPLVLAKRARLCHLASPRQPSQQEEDDPQACTDSMAQSATALLQNYVYFTICIRIDLTKCKITCPAHWSMRCLILW